MDPSLQAEPARKSKRSVKSSTKRRLPVRRPGSDVTLNSGSNVSTSSGYGSTRAKSRSSVSLVGSRSKTPPPLDSARGRYSARPALVDVPNSKSSQSTQSPNQELSSRSTESNLLFEVIRPEQSLHYADLASSFVIHTTPIQGQLMGPNTNHEERDVSKLENEPDSTDYVQIVDDIGDKDVHFQQNRDKSESKYHMYDGSDMKHNSDLHRPDDISHSRERLICPTDTTTKHDTAYFASSGFEPVSPEPSLDVSNDSITPRSSYRESSIGDSTDAEDDDYWDFCFPNLEKHEAIMKIVEPVLELLKHYSPKEAAERVSLDFDCNWLGNLRCHARDNSTTQSTTKLQSSASSTAPSQGSKRARRYDESPNRERDGKRRQPIHSQPHLGEPQPPLRKFACPFHKNSPHIYNTNERTGARYRACAGPGWVDVHRVKEHLYRLHMAPMQCARCYREFNDEQSLEAHQRADEICAIVHTPMIAQGLRIAQRDQLRRKTKTCKAEEDKWKDMYLIVFPGTSLEAIPSPFYNYSPDILAFQFRGLVTEEISRLVRQVSDRGPSQITEHQEIELVEALGSLFCTWMTQNLSQSGHSASSEGSSEPSFNFDATPGSADSIQASDHNPAAEDTSNENIEDVMTAQTSSVEPNQTTHFIPVDAFPPAEASFFDSDFLCFENELYMAD